MPDTAPPHVSRLAHAPLPRFRPFVGVEVLLKALPAEVLDATRASSSEYSLRLMSKVIDPVWAGRAKSPEQLSERFKAPNVACAADVPIHVDVAHEDLAGWQLDPRVAILAVYPREPSDLPIVEYSLGHFGAVVIDFKIFTGDVVAAVSDLQKLGTVIGEVVAIAPAAALPLFAPHGLPIGASDPDRSTPALQVGEIVVIFGREAHTADERFAADNETAAWTEALDYLSLSPRLELKTRYTRQSGLARAVALAHYQILRRSTFYRRIANRVRAAGSAVEVVTQRWSNDMEYFRWKHFRGGRRR